MNTKSLLTVAFVFALTACGGGGGGGGGSSANMEMPETMVVSKEMPSMVELEMPMDRFAADPMFENFIFPEGAIHESGARLTYDGDIVNGKYYADRGDRGNFQKLTGDVHIDLCASVARGCRSDHEMLLQFMNLRRDGVELAFVVRGADRVFDFRNWPDMNVNADGTFSHRGDFGDDMIRGRFTGQHGESAEGEFFFNRHGHSGNRLEGEFTAKQNPF